jgi:hypothetical protein
MGRNPMQTELQLAYSVPENAETATMKGDELIERLKDNVLTYEYQESPRTVKVKLVNPYVSRCYS